MLLTSLGNLPLLFTENRLISLLNSYNEEREPVAKMVLSLTDSSPSWRLCRAPWVNNSGTRYFRFSPASTRWKIGLRRPWLRSGFTTGGVRSYLAKPGTQLRPEIARRIANSNSGPPKTH